MSHPASLSFQELEQAMEASRSAGRRRLALLPLGCTEQHGPVLPLETDSVIAAGLVRDLAGRLPGAHPFPNLPYTTTEPNAAFCGTVSVPAPLFRAYLEQVCRGILSHPFDALVMVNAHGSIEPSIREVAFGLVMEQFRAGAAPIRPVLAVSAFEFEAALEARFQQKPGRHADWRELLLLYRELGGPERPGGYFTPARLEALERFAQAHDFDNLCLPAVLGIPMERRSAEGVQGQPLPTSRADMAGQAEALWAFLLDQLEARITGALEDFEGRFARLVP